MRSVVPVLLSAAAILPALAQSGFVVVGKQLPGGQIVFQPYEVFLANGRDTVRVLPGSPSTIDDKAYGRLARVKLPQAGVLRREGNLIVQISPSDEGSRAVVLPDQLRFQGTQKVDEIWNGIAFSGKRSRRDPEETAFTSPEFFALLPGSGASSVIAFTSERSNFGSVEEHLRTIAGAAASFPKSELDALRAYLAGTLAAGLRSFESGGAYALLVETIKYADTAEAAFPGSAGIPETGRALRERKAFVDALAVKLQSLYDAGKWDGFIDKYAEFEQYQSSFPELKVRRVRAARESARLHARRGRELHEGRGYAEAMNEFRIACRRDPANVPLRALAEEKRIEASLAIARRKAGTIKILGKDSPQAVRFEMHLGYAAKHITDRKLSDAAQEIAAAAGLNPESPQLLLTKAKLLYARSEFSEALAMLNAYDESVTEPADRKLGEDLRAEVASSFNKRRADSAAAFERLYRDGRFSEALALANQSVQLDGENADFLYYSGVLSAILKKDSAAAERLRGYLNASATLAEDPRRRERAHRVLTLIGTPRPAASSTVPGTANWFSGRALGSGVFYCPESLAFQPKVALVRNGKQEQTFEWTEQGRLRAVASKFEDERALREYLARTTGSGKLPRAGAPSATPPGSFFFEYFANAPQVARIAEEKIDSSTAGSGFGIVATRIENGAIEIGLAAPGEKPDARWRHITLARSPIVNPEVLAVVEGPATIGFAPNPYFNPLVWTGAHLFRYSYDSLGRVASASEIGAPRLARFAWEGERLQSLTVYTVEGSRERQVYRRTMNYGGDKLVSENVEYGGRQYKIVYKYLGDKLSEASFEDTGAHGGGEWQIRFL